MRALRLTAWQQAPSLVDVPEPEPHGSEVLVRIGGAGLCHSDLHLIHDFPADIAPYEVPFTLGHENAGWVEAVGADVRGVDVGTPVAVYGHWGCGTCPRCDAGVENHCERRAERRAAGGGIGLDGGMAELMLVPHPRLLVPLNGLSPVEAAPLTDAGLTAYHAVLRSMTLLTEGATVLVLGVGGLGHLALQLLRALSPATVIAVDPRPEALSDAVRHGAAHALTFGPETTQQVRDLTHGHGAELVLDFVGSSETMQLAMASARTFGHVTVVGIAGGSYRFSSLLAPQEVSLSTTYWGTRPELRELLALASSGAVKADIETIPLEEAPAAVARLAAGQIRGRAVIVPSPPSTRSPQ